MSRPSSWTAQAWSLLTAVPGQPAASGARRLGRALPLLLPLAALLSLAAWKWGWEDPRVRAERLAGRPLAALAGEVAALRLHRSPSEAPEAEGAGTLRRALPHGLEGLPPVLAGLEDPRRLSRLGGRFWSARRPARRRGGAAGGCFRAGRPASGLRQPALLEQLDGTFGRIFCAGSANRGHAAGHSCR